MKKISKILLIFTFLMVSLLSAQSAFCAAKYKIVLFYADWNVYSAKAINTMERVSSLSNGKFTLKKINIDDQSSIFDIQHLGIRPKHVIPCYYVVDKNDRILYETKYIDEKPEEILKNIKKALDN